MKYASAALLALLLVLSLPAMTVVATNPSDVGGETANYSANTERIASGLVDVEETTNRLVLDGESRSGYASTGPDLGTVLATTDDELRTDHDRFDLDREFEGMTADERAAAIDATYDRISQRIDALEQRERVAVSQHANGELTDVELQIVLVRNYHEAGTLQDVLGELNEYAHVVPDYSISDSVRVDRGTLDIYRSPVRAQLADATEATGGSESVDSTLQTTETGFVLSMVDDGTYVREAVRFDNRDTARPDQFGSNTNAFEYVADELYPWAFNVSTTSGSSQYADPQLYRIHATHTHGELGVYLDGGTGDVYREIQTLTVAGLPSTPMDQSWTNGTLELSINQTPVDGPVEVTVTDVETGEPVEATIEADEYVVGETRDGTLWLLPPASEYEITATAGDESVTAPISGE